uniref:Uncharacterized protein n=1 Tax=Proboscia inermis TaxID=420281 RepID=A0A7S0GJ65_9STRA|mmetsp:Transcript_55400/g.64793  ORF Transcript_55400/g.64793 Transcript_55400/m.64793 type:complete len:137 (-) Transcript_55400:416-826(-)
MRSTMRLQLFLFSMMNLGYCGAFQGPISSKRTVSKTALSAEKNCHEFDRRKVFLSVLSTTAFATFLNPDVVLAKVDPAVVGTKKDPKYQNCLSVCVFECTKPKGEEQKLRSECIPECKKKCAVNKEQLLLGQPLKK